MELLTNLRRRLRRGAWMAAISLCACGAVRAAAPTEYQIKAAFIYNFTQFIHWPTDAFKAPNAPIAIGILGDDPFGKVMEETVQGETVRSHPLSVVRSPRAEDLRGCQIVFVSASEKAQLAHVFETLGPRPILTISDVSGFVQAGGVINFYREGTRVRFEISPVAAKACGLRVSSQLLKLARIIGGTTQGDF